MATKTETNLRTYVEDEQITQGVRLLREKLQYRLNTKGRYSYASRHEIYGIIDEERFEVLQALQANASHEDFQQELLDVAVAAIFGFICCYSQHVE